MLWLNKNALLIKTAVVLGSILILVFSITVSANCVKSHTDSNQYKYIPRLMALHFSDLDKDRDGQISLYEFSSEFNTLEESTFENSDKDSSIGLDRGEWNAFKVLHTGMGSHHGNHGGKPDRTICL